MTIFIGADHAGYNLKESLKEFLSGKGYTIKDCGAFSYDEQDDYPDFIRPVAEGVAKCEEGSPSLRSGQNRCFGIVIGGSGQGEAMVANRIQGVRAAVYYGPASVSSSDKSSADKKPTDGKSSDPYEILKLSREHNDANILSLGARFLTEEEAKRAVELWLATPFSNEERHVRRIKKVG